MSDIPKIEIKNKENIFGATKKNTDGSPIQELTNDGKRVAVIKNLENTAGVSKKNSDGTPIKEITTP